MDKMEDAIKKSKSLNVVFDNIFKEYETIQSNNNIKILILNTPCHGFGDLIFGMKLAGYLTEWYPNATVNIASTLPDGLVKLGFDKDRIVQLGRNSPQCRRFKHLDIVNYKTKREYKNAPKYDLLFVAPLAQDYEVSRADVKALFPYSTRANTFFFSEYNDSLRKEIDFPTGVGRGRLGIFLTDAKPSNESLIKEDYAVAYIAESISKSFDCFFSFFQMLSAKHPDKPFSIIVPKWIADKWIKVVKQKDRDARRVVVVVKEGKYEFGNVGKPITLRGDVFPVSNRDMITLMYHSMDDILLTGDQSITDALSCCWKKNIFYQIAPWKVNFGHHLAQKLPNKYLCKKKTSCGTISAIEYDSDYAKFLKEWDFRVLGRPKMTGIINYTANKKTSRKMKRLEETVLSSRSLRALKQKIDF